MAVTELLYKLTADGSAFSREFSQAEREVQRFNRRAESSFAKFGKVAGVASGLVVAGFAAAFHETARFASEIDYMADRVGLGNEELSALAYAADQSDVSLGTLERRLNRFNQEVEKAGSGGGSTAAMMRSLGIAARDADGNLRSNIDVLMDVADAVAATEDHYEQAAIAAEFFGQRGGPEMLPLLQSGSDGIREMGEEAEALGLIIDDRTGAAARQFGDDMTRLTGLVKGMAINIGSQMLPAISAYTEAMTKSAIESNKGAGNMGFFAKATEVVLKVVEGARAAFVLFGETIGMVAGTIFETFMGAWDAIKSFASGVGNVFNALKARDIEGLKTAFVGAGADIAASAKKTVDGMKAGWAGYAEDVEDILRESNDRLLLIEQASRGEIVHEHQEASRDIGETWGATVEEIDRRQQELVSKTGRWLDQLKTPAQRFGEDLADLWEAFDRGIISEEQFDLIEQQLLELHDPFGEFAEAAKKAQEEADFADYVRGLEAEAEKVIAAFHGIDLAAKAHLESLQELHDQGLITWEQYTWAVQQASEEVEQATEAISEFEVLGASALESLGTHLVDYVVDPFNTSIDEMLENFLKAMARMATEAAMQLALNAALGGIGGGLMPVQAFSTGGYVAGPGTSTSDSIPALLSDGEYVLRASAVRSIGKQALDQLNQRGRMPRYAGGGPVGRVPSGGDSAGGGVNVVVVASMEDAIAEALRRPRGKSVIVDIMQEAMPEIEGLS